MRLVKLTCPQCAAVVDADEAGETHLAAGRTAYARRIQMVAHDPFGTMDPRQKVGPQINAVERR